MPNWCTNEVTVTGDEDKVEEFRKYVEGEYYHCLLYTSPSPRD